MQIVRAILVAGLLGLLSFHPIAASPERVEADTLSGLAESQADFRGCDRDWNRVADFWTVDVTGLYTVTSTDVLLPGTDGALRVIEFTRNGADGQEEP